MKRIKLTQGQYALVDDADYTWLNQHKWYAHKDHSGDFYVMRHSPMIRGKQHLIHMHRFILALEKGDKRQGDHINHNTLDNRQSNLRICTNQQNAFNQKSHSNTSSQFKGVYWNKNKKKWRTQIVIKGKTKHIGYFDTEEEAAEAYDKAATEEFGEFACLNFPLTKCEKVIQ